MHWHHMGDMGDRGYMGVRDDIVDRGDMGHIDSRGDMSDRGDMQKV